jgi:hypothetical protein
MGGVGPEQATVHLSVPIELLDLQIQSTAVDGRERGRGVGGGDRVLADGAEIVHERGERLRDGLVESPKMPVEGHPVHLRASAQLRDGERPEVVLRAGGVEDHRADPCAGARGARVRGVSDHRTLACPPSTGRSWPVMKREASEARKTITGPRSRSGSPYWWPRAIVASFIQ